jgi:hypothetical protein
MLRRFIVHPVTRSLLAHPQHDRFDAMEFEAGLSASGFRPLATQDVFGVFAWFAAYNPRTDTLGAV